MPKLTFSAASFFAFALLLTSTTPLTFAHAQTSAAPDLLCAGCGNSGGGGGGGGGSAPPSAGGALNWSSPTTDGYGGTGFVGGVSGRQGPAVANNFYQDAVSVAYTSSNLFDSEGDYYVYYGTYPNTSNGQQAFQYLNVSNGTAASSSNPAMQTASVGGGQGTTIFMALNSNQAGANNGGGVTGILSNTSVAPGGNWSYIDVLGSGATANYPPASYSPSLAASSQYLFLAPATTTTIL